MLGFHKYVRSINILKLSDHLRDSLMFELEMIFNFFKEVFKFQSCFNLYKLQNYV